MSVKTLLIAGGLWAACLPFSFSQTPASRSAGSDKVVATLQAAFHAAETDDLAGFHSQVTKGFYIFDSGVRYDAPALIARLKQVHASGTHIAWTVTVPDVHIDGRTAWVAYVNEGTVTTPAGSMHRSWLESAFLVKDGEGWKVAFWHSTPVKDPENTGKH